jgi:hypothetical protein
MKASQQFKKTSQQSRIASQRSAKPSLKSTTSKQPTPGTRKTYLPTDAIETAKIRIDKVMQRRKLNDSKDRRNIPLLVGQIYQAAGVQTEKDSLPRFKFDQDAFCDVQKDERLETHVLAPIFQSQYTLESTRIQVAETHFQAFLLRIYASCKSRPKGRAADMVWIEKMRTFAKHQELMEKYWDRISLKFCTKPNQIVSEKFRGMLPLYLFYVEMINTVVPRPAGEELSNEAELLQASAIYINYTRKIDVFLIDFSERWLRSKVGMEEEKTEARYFRELKRRDENATAMKNHLWAFLEVWMEKQRPSLFYDNCTHTGLFLYAGRAFFNDIYIYSAENFIKFIQRNSVKRHVG